MREIVVFFVLWHALVVNIVVAAIHSPHRVGEVGRSRQRHSGGKHVADHLHFVAEEFHRFPETIDFSVERQRGIEVEKVVEAVGCVHHLARCLGIPLAAYLGRVHTVIHGDRGRDVDVFEKRECGRHRQGVAHAVAPVFDETFLEKLVLLGCERVLELACV